MSDNKKTKIIATLGPASDSKEKIAELIEAGVNIFRFNLKHAEIEWHKERIKRVEAIAKRLKKPIGILIDLQGPEIRIQTKKNEEIPVRKGDNIIFAMEFSKTKKSVVIPNKNAFKLLSVKETFFIDDGFIEFIIINVKEGTFTAQALEDGIIKNNKGINFPGKNIELPSLISEDLKKLNVLKNNRIDFIALSFSRTKRDINMLSREMKRRKINAGIIAKIESRQALNNIDEIVEAADGIMVARGDLGIEVPIEELAYQQKKIVRKCRLAKKPVIVATQMLQSMTENPRPTRAEATDVANAVFDGADAVMLSAETAVGKYPVLSVAALARILKFNEKKAKMPKIKSDPKGSTQLVVNAVMAILENQPKEARERITTAVALTESGYTARVLSSYRPKINVIALTNTKEAVNRLALSYGITPLYVPSVIKAFKSYYEIMERLKKEKMVKGGENILVIHGRHTEEPGLINSLALFHVS